MFKRWLEMTGHTIIRSFDDREMIKNQWSDCSFACLFVCHWITNRWSSNDQQMINSFTITRWWALLVCLFLICVLQCCVLNLHNTSNEFIAMCVHLKSCYLNWQCHLCMQCLLCNVCNANCAYNATYAIHTMPIVYTMPFVEATYAILADNAIYAIYSMPIMHAMPFVQFPQCQLCI